MARRVIAYIDGFNLYHAIDDLGDSSLKWVNLWSLSASLLRTNEQLTAVKYCSAYATWMAGPFSRHRQYVRALECAGVLPIMGRFKDKPRQCHACKARWISHEEKETDVNIAIHLVRDAILNQFDRAIVISADSDLVPAVKLAAEHDQTKEVFVAAPPGRFASARDLKPRLEITIGRIRKHLFPASLTHPDGKPVTRPPEYDPK
jgi:NYN domain